MPATVNLTTEFSDKVAERITKMSVTDGAASSEYTFAGIKTLEVYSVDVVALQNYNRAATANRYGTPGELGDSLQIFTMSQDKSFTYTIDKGNEMEQMNIKKANETLKREIDEVIVPTLDRYRIDRWSHMAGSILPLTGAINQNSIIGFVLDSNEKLDDRIVPLAGRILYIKNSGYKALIANPSFVGSDSIVRQTLIQGQIGEIDGMPVVKVPASYFPAGVEWLITYKAAILAPKKLADYKIHTDPPGLSGNLVEGRILHDAFVIGAKGNAVLIAINNAYSINIPTLVNDAANTNYNIATTTAGADLWYTTDGTDPRYSNSAVKIGANNGKITFASLNAAATDSNGHVNIKAAAVPNTNTAMFWSEVSNAAAYS